MNSVALPIIEYRAITSCNRILSWSATSPESAMYEIKRDKLLTVVEIMPFKLWEALQTDGYEQLELNLELEGVNTKNELQISAGYYQPLQKGA